MIEPIMYFGIGFLIAALIGIVVVPLVHGRAVRLTMRRLEAATPLSMAEAQADKDHLRAEFAMAMRRLEMNIEQLKIKSTSQLAELGKKSNAVNQLKIELGEKTATIFALEARDKALRDQLRATEEQLAARTGDLADTERARAETEAERAKLAGALDERSSLADAQKVAIAALNTELDTLKERLATTDKELKAVEIRRDAERVELKAATQELSEERGRVENLGRRIVELEQALAAQTAETGSLARRAQDLEERLSEQSRARAATEFALEQLRGEMGIARGTESELRNALAELDSRSSFANQRLQAENTQLAAELERLKEERSRLLRDLDHMNRQADEVWAAERIENALLRERISGVAAEVARLASALEGPNSTIDAILASGAARDRVGGAVAEDDVALASAPPSNGNLADRIRALQTHAAGASHADPKTRN